MSIRLLATLTAAVMVPCLAAHAASGAIVSKKIELKGASAADVMSRFGGFCAIKDWHPAVAKCDETQEGGATFRTLTLQDGAQIKEKLTGKSEEGYKYSIISSPLPVKDYMATFSVKAEGDAVVVNWLASFQAKDKPESEAKQVIEGIFDAGLKSIAGKAAK